MRINACVREGYCMTYSIETEIWLGPVPNVPQSGASTMPKTMVPAGMAMDKGPESTASTEGSLLRVTVCRMPLVLPVRLKVSGPDWEQVLSPLATSLVIKILLEGMVTMGNSASRADIVPWMYPVRYMCGAAFMGGSF